MPEEEIIKSPDTLRQARIPPGQTATSKFPVLHYGDVHRIHISKWSFRIFGLVEQAKTLDYQQFMQLPKIKVFSDIHCVTGWSKLDNLWEGPCSAVIKDLVKILPEANFISVHAAAGFTTNLTLDDFFASDVLFAVQHNGEFITAEHGYPVRLVVPRLYFWKSAKWVSGIEFLRDDKPGFWESMGYHNHGDPWKEERYGRQR